MGDVLNQPSVKALVDNRCGVVYYPTIHEVVDTLFAAASVFGWKRCHVIFEKFESVGLTCLPPSVSLVMFPGVFSWSGPLLFGP